MSYEQNHQGKSPTDVLTELYELAVNRFLDADNFDYRDYLTDEELAQYQEAERLGTSHLTPAARTVGKVIIEVYGGVADVTSKPDDIEVEIIDHDNEMDEGAEGFIFGPPLALDNFLEKVDMPQDGDA